MSILNNLRKELDIASQEGAAWFEEANQLAHSLDLTPEELNEALNLLQELKRERALTNGIKKQSKLLQELTRYV